MLVKEILHLVDLNVTLPNNILNEDLEDVTPTDYIKMDNSYIIRFKNSNFVIIINLNNDEEHFIMTERFEDMRDIYVSYNVDGQLHSIS